MAKKSTPAAGIPAGLANFDTLPDSAFVKLPVVLGLCDCSAATAYRRIAAGILPTPKKFGPHSSAWNVGELRRALAA